MYLVCGEALYDVFVAEQSDDGSMRLDARVGGSPFNVTLGLSRLNTPAALFTAVSEDMLGERLNGILKMEGVNRDYLLRSGRRTTLSIVGLNDEGQPEYVFYGLGSADCGVTVEDLPTLGSDIKGIHFGSYSLAVDPVAGALKELNSRHPDLFISLDPNVRPTVEPDLDKWRESIAAHTSNTDLLKISMEDLALLHPQWSAERFADWAMDKGVALVIVTDGGAQVRAWTQQGDASSHKPSPIDIVDTVGAGDSFQSAALAKLAEWGAGDPAVAIPKLDGDRLQELLMFGSHAAGLTCQRRGANLPTSSELQVNQFN